MTETRGVRGCLCCGARITRSPKAASLGRTVPREHMEAYRSPFPGWEARGRRSCPCPPPAGDPPPAPQPVGTTSLGPGGPSCLLFHLRGRRTNRAQDKGTGLWKSSWDGETAKENMGGDKDSFFMTFVESPAIGSQRTCTCSPPFAAIVAL